MPREFFSSNIRKNGRLLRGVIGGFCFVATVPLACHSRALALVLAIAGLFMIFEAARGWCLLRACGFRTPL